MCETIEVKILRRDSTAGSDVSPRLIIADISFADASAIFATRRSLDRATAPKTRLALDLAEVGRRATESVIEMLVLWMNRA